MNVWISQQAPGNGVALFDAPYNYYTVIDKNDPEDRLVHKVFPIPASNNVIIEFELPKPENVSIQLFSPIGQRLGIPMNDFFPMGKNQLELDLSDYSPGICFYTIQAGEYKSSGKIIILK